MKYFWAYLYTYFYIKQLAGEQSKELEGLERSRELKHS